jgi:GxxExxY protein
MSRGELIHARLTHSAIGAFYEVYNTLGYGFREHIYRKALERELLARGHRVAREVSVPVFYKGDLLGYDRIDMIVDETLVVETKSRAKLRREDLEQLKSYLHSTKLELAILFHFGPKPRFYRAIARTVLDR